MKQYAPWKFPTDFQGLFFGRERIPELIFVPDAEDLVPSHSYPAQLSKEMPVLLLNDASNTSKISKFCSAEQRNGQNFTQRLSKPHRDYLSHKGLNLIWND